MRPEPREGSAQRAQCLGAEVGAAPTPSAQLTQTQVRSHSWKWDCPYIPVGKNIGKNLSRGKDSCWCPEDRVKCNSLVVSRSGFGDPTSLIGKIHRVSLLK